MPSPKKSRVTKKAQENMKKRNSEESDTSQEDSYTEDEDQKRNLLPESPNKTPKSSKSPAASTRDSAKKLKTIKPTPEKRVMPRSPPAKSAKNSTHKKLYLKCIVILIAVSFGIYMYYRYPHMLQIGTDQNTENKNSTDPLVKIKEDFKRYLSELQGIFITQDKDFWKKIKVPVLRVIKEEEPEYPAVLMLVVPKGESTSQTATCLAKKYRSNLSKLYRGSGNINEAYIDAQTLSSSGSVENIKYDLDNKIKELLDDTNTELPTMVIDHIEALDPNVMLLFHGYCDGDYAPHKKALILFVLHTNLDSKEIKNLDRTVDGLLQSLWGKNLDADKIPPLIARIANNKAMIHEEKMSSLTKSGC